MFRFDNRMRISNHCGYTSSFLIPPPHAAFAPSQGTLLVLDEPTNHLDIPSKEMLEEALQRFDGSVIAVSHDRYFLRRIATRVVTVRSGLLPPLAVPCPAYSEPVKMVLGVLA